MNRNSVILIIASLAACGFVSEGTPTEESSSSSSSDDTDLPTDDSSSGADDPSGRFTLGDEESSGSTTSPETTDASSSDDGSSESGSTGEETTSSSGESSSSTTEDVGQPQEGVYAFCDANDQSACVEDQFCLLSEDGTTGWCSTMCEVSSDCPVPPMGTTAEAYCGDYGPNKACMLACLGTDCPSEMDCDSDFDTVLGPIQYVCV